jgi:DNA-binding transcriptional ArsR family regulator
MADQPVSSSDAEATAPVTTQNDTSAPADTDERDFRDLNDPLAMRALAHPVRLALLEVLALEGPLTATKAAELLDESPGNMSWHLQTLAKYGFVEEAGGGVGRARPWKLVNLGQRFRVDDSTAPETKRAAGALAELFNERVFQNIREWAVQRSSYPLEWQQSAFAVHVLSYMTPTEMAEVNDAVLEVLSRFHGRLTDPSTRPTDALPVGFSAYGNPMPNPRPTN